MISYFRYQITVWVGSVSLHPFFNNYCRWSAYFEGGTLIRSLLLNGIIDLIKRLLMILFDWFIILSKAWLLSFSYKLLYKLYKFSLFYKINFFTFIQINGYSIQIFMLLSCLFHFYPLNSFVSTSSSYSIGGLMCHTLPSCGKSG